jgi:hypothetical protein
VVDVLQNWGNGLGVSGFLIKGNMGNSGLLLDLDVIFGCERSTESKQRARWGLEGQSERLEVFHTERGETTVFKDKRLKRETSECRDRTVVG